MKTDNSIAVAGLIALAMPVGAATGYLRALGPSPVYFRAPRPPGPGFVLPPLDMGRPPANPMLPGKEPPDSASWAPASANEGGAVEAISPSVSPSPAPTGAPAVAGQAKPAPIPGTGMGMIPAIIGTGAGNIAGEQPDAAFLMPMSTQALIPFFTRQFNGGTNAPKVSVVLPVEFHPARPPEVPPSSSATFTQEKK